MFIICPLRAKKPLSSLFPIFIQSRRAGTKATYALHHYSALYAYQPLRLEALQRNPAARSFHRNLSRVQRHPQSPDSMLELSTKTVNAGHCLSDFGSALNEREFSFDLWSPFAMCLNCSRVCGLQDDVKSGTRGLMAWVEKATTN